MTRVIFAEGCREMDVAGVRHYATGYRCPSCGFGSYLRRCGRCGSECERE